MTQDSVYIFSSPSASSASLFATTPGTDPFSGGLPLRAALEAGGDLTADHVVKSRNLARELGLPEQLVSADMGRAEQEAVAARLEQNLPLARWAAMSKENAALAKDDLQGLGDIFSWIGRRASANLEVMGGAHDAGREQLRLAVLGSALRNGDESVIPQIAALKLSLEEKSRKKKQSGTLAEIIGLASAAEQIPRMMETTIPSATEGMAMFLALEGAAAATGTAMGAAAGSVIPGAGTAAGGLLGGTTASAAALPGSATAGWATFMTGQMRRNFYFERNSFLADLALEKDSQGRSLDPEIRNAAADIYGGISAALEGGSELLFLKLLKPLAGSGMLRNMETMGPKAFIRSAIRRAALDNTVRGRLLDIGARIAGGSLVEGGTELLQEVASILMEYGAKEADTAVHGTTFDNELLTEEHAARLTESFVEGAKAAIWLRGAPIAATGAFSVAGARAAENFANTHAQLHEKVEAAKLKSQAPDLLQSALEFAGVDETAYLPADAVLEMHRNGIDLTDIIGFDQESLTEAAAMGHGFEVPLSRLHARLDAEQFGEVARVMRAVGNASSLKDIEEHLARFDEDPDYITDVMESMRAWETRAERDQSYSQEKTRLIDEMTAAGRDTAMAEADASIIMARNMTWETIYGREFFDGLESMRRVKFVSGEGGGGASLLQAAMIRAADATVADFARRVSTEGEVKKSFFEMRPGHGAFSGVSVRLPADTIRHRDKRHPDMTDEDMNRLPQVLDSLNSENSALPKKDVPRFAGKGVIGWAKVDGQAYGIVLESVRPDRGIVATYFKDSEAAVRAWFEQNADRKKAVTTPAALWPAQASSEDVLRNQPFSEKNITLDDTEVNEIVDTAPGTVGGQSEFFQPGIEEVRLADEALARDVEAWGKSVDALEKSAWNMRDNMTMLNQTPLVLQMLGARNLPVQMSPGKLARAMKEHDLSPDLVKQVPAAMADPIMVFGSATQGGDVVMMLELKDQHGGTIVVPMTLEIETPGGYTANIATSIYGKTNEKTLKPSNTWFTRQIQDGNLLYQHHKKSRDWARTSRLQLPGANTRTVSAQKRLYTDADLVKLREANPALYQSAPQGPRGGVALDVETAPGVFNDVITLFKGADASTVIHEAWHLFQRDMEALAARPGAPEALKRDYALTLDYLTRLDDDAVLKAQYDKFVKIRPEFAGKDFDALTAEQKERARAIAKNEYFARSGEAYMREGVAPSFELARVFHNFRAWLLNLYRSLRGLDVQLTPEIRGVFDRMLASDEQIAQVTTLTRLAEEEAGRLAALKEDYPAIGDQEMAELNRAYEDAHRSATNAMDRATLREFNKRRRDALEQARAIVDAEPVYMAAAEIRKNPDKDLRGISYAHLVENYSKQTADEIRSKFPGIVNKKGGLGADVVCTGLGYESGDDLVYALADAEKRGKRINDLAEQIMREHDEMLLPDQAALATESYGVYLEKFHAALSKTLRKVTYSPREYLRRNAHDYARALPVREATRYDTHQHTMRQQMAARLEAAKAGDARAEMMALEKLRLAHEMVGEAVLAREQVDNLVKRIQRIVKTKSMDSQMRDQVLSLADRFSIGTGQKPRNPEHLVPLDTILAGRVDEEFGWAVSFPPLLTNGLVHMDYRDLSMHEFGQLDNLIKHLEKRGRDEHRESKASAAARIDNVVKAAIAPSVNMKAKGVYTEGSVFRRMTDESREFFASMDSLQFLLRSFDNYSNVGPDGVKGPNERLIWERIVEGSNGRKRFAAKAEADLRPHFDRLTKSARVWEKKHGKRLHMEGVSVPASMKEIGRGWSADAVITMCLHMGSESNMARLRAGYPDLDAQTIENLTGLLDEADWDAIQGIWDAIGKHWEKLDEVHYKINGFHMNKIQPRPFMPVGLEKKGIVKKLNGGYFPAIYDPAQSRFMREMSEADSLFAQTEAIYQTPAAKKGMTQSRKNKAPGLPLLLSTSVITKHMQDVGTYIHLAIPVREADMVTRDSKYEAAFVRAFGRDAYDQIRPNLKGTVRPEPIGNGFFDRKVEVARSYATPFYLAWNLKTVISQFLSAGRGLHDIGVRDYARGLKLTMMNNPVQKIRWIMEVSPYMAERAYSRDRELAARAKKLGIDTRSLRLPGTEFTWEDAVNIGFTPMIVADWMTAYPIWLGKYESAMEKNGGDMEAAVLEADDAVRFSQSSANAEDMSDYLRSGKGFKRLLSMFGTDNIGRYGQRQRYHYRAWRAGKMTNAGYAWFNVCEAILPALGMRMLQELFWRSQPVPDGDDEKGWRDFLADVFGDIFLQGLPLVGNLLSSSRKPLDTPVGAITDRAKQAVENTTKAFALAADMDDEEAQEKALEGVMVLFSIISKMPVSQIMSRWRRGHEQYERSDDATPMVYLMPEPKR